MDNLRLILIVLGLIILAGIILFHRPKGQSQPNHARWRQGRREPSLGDGDAEDSAAAPAPDRDSADFSASSDDAARSKPATSKAAASTEATKQAADKGKAPSLPPSQDKIITLYIRRRKERPIGGSDLLDAAVKAGLSFGEMNIFHRWQEGANKPVFSMANLTPPGHFDPSAWNLFETPGVTLFATLPGPVSGLDAWDAMLATGSRIAELLDADLLDDGKCVLTRQRIGQIREALREHDRLHGLGGG